MNSKRLVVILSGIGLVIVMSLVIYFTSNPVISTDPAKVNQAALKGEALAGVQQQQQSSVSTAQFPILNQLPVTTDIYKIGSGFSPTHKGNASYFAIYIYADTAVGKASALRWMTDNGYQPSDYEIIYQGY